MTFCVTLMAKSSKNCQFFYMTNTDDIKQLCHEPDGLLVILPLVKLIFAGFISISVTLSISIRNSEEFTFFFKVTFNKFYFFQPNILKKAAISQVIFDKFYIS